MLELFEKRFEKSRFFSTVSDARGEINQKQQANNSHVKRGKLCKGNEGDPGTS